MVGGGASVLVDREIGDGHKSDGYRARGHWIAGRFAVTRRPGLLRCGSRGELGVEPPHTLAFVRRLYAPPADGSPVWNAPHDVVPTQKGALAAMGDADRFSDWEMTQHQTGGLASEAPSWIDWTATHPLGEPFAPLQ